MTIEKEAREIVERTKNRSRWDMENQTYVPETFPWLEKDIAKALQKKQDRIEELERKLADYHDAYEGKKHRIYELENEIRAYDLDIYGADGAKEISNMRKRIAELEKKTVQAIAADFYLSEFNQANEKIKELEFIIKSDVPFGTMLLNADKKVKELEKKLANYSAITKPTMFLSDGEVVSDSPVFLNKEFVCRHCQRVTYYAWRPSSYEDFEMGKKSCEYRIAELESALKECIGELERIINIVSDVDEESINEVLERAKKAIGGGNG